MQSWSILNEKGEKLTDLSNVLDEWRKYCGGLFDDTPAYIWNNQALETEKELHILREEVENAIRRLKTGKATAADRISTEVIRAMGAPGVDHT